MKKVTDYKIHLKISAAGNPVTGYVEYKLIGDEDFRSTATLVPADIGVLASVLINNNIYFDEGLNEFVRSN